MYDVGQVRYEMFIFQGDEIILINNIDSIQVSRNNNNYVRVLTNTNLSKFTKVQKMCLFTLMNNAIVQAVTANMKYGFDIPFPFLEACGGGFEIKKAVVKTTDCTRIHIKNDGEYIRDLYRDTSSLYKLREILK